MKAIGFTTMPSPPLPVSSSHQRVASLSSERVQLCHLMLGNLEQRGIGLAQPRSRVHVPQMVPIGVHPALAGQQVEGRKPDIGERCHRPAVPGIRVAVELGEAQPLFDSDWEASPASIPRAAVC